MKTFSIVVISIFLIISGISGCIFTQFSSNPESRPIFIQKVGGQSLVVPVHGLELQIEENSSVQAYCPGGFRETEIRERMINENGRVELTCIAGNTVVRKDDRSYYFEQYEVLKCTGPPFAIYENRQNRRNCEGTSYVVSMLYENVPINLAEICYDMDKMKVKYQNYKAVDRSPVISQKREYEPFRYYLQDDLLVDAPSQQFYQHFLLSHNHTRKRFIHKSVEYVYEDLIPGDAFEPYYEHVLNAAKALSKIFWWKGLKYGNWRLFEKILKRRSGQKSYDVLMGIMGTSPDCDMKEGPLSEMSLSCSVTPKFVWAYLSDEKTEEDFVVIGINTPYLEYLSANDTIICQDMCDSITWLEPLNKFRNISAFGYIYCCRAEEVRYKMEGVRDLFFKEHYPYEGEQKTPEPTEDSGSEEKPCIVETEREEPTTYKPFAFPWGRR